MKHPRINSAIAVDDHTLLVEFENSIRKRYDVSPLFDREAFSLLRNAAVFKNVQVEKGGFAVFWNADIDLSEYELWKNGELITN